MPSPRVDQAPPLRLRRSCLAVPGTSARALAKAPTLAVDMVFLDLEDSVPEAQKTDETRLRVAEALRGPDWRAATLAVRVNEVGSAWWEDDLRVVVGRAGASLDCVIVPKVESVDELAAVDRLLTDLEEEADAGRPIGIEVQIESARGLVEVERIAGSSQPRLETLVFGPGDYAATLGVPQRSVGETDPDYPGDQWHYARSRIATAAHAFGLAPIDGPYAAIRDLDGLRESARQARLVGFEGKWLVHPDQIPVCDEVFSPTPEELADALSVLEGLEGAAAEGRGASLHDGRMVDEASRRIAEAVVRRAEAAGVGAS